MKAVFSLTIMPVKVLITLNMRMKFQLIEIALTF